MIALRTRYRISPTGHWWEDAERVEARAALAAWSRAMNAASGITRRKLALLYDLERVHELLRGSERFYLDRDGVRSLLDRQRPSATIRSR